MLDFSEYLGALEEDEFEETPVPLETYLYSKEYLGVPILSDLQFEMVQIGSQILKKNTLINLYGETAGLALWKKTKKENIFMVGKGCSAPYNEVYDSMTGKWERLDSLKDSYEGFVHGLHGSEFRTESWYAGTGEMLRVTTELGFETDVYEDHSFHGYTKSRFYHRYRGYSPDKMVAKKLSIGDRIAVPLNLDVKNENKITEDEALVVGTWLGDGCMPSQSNNVINVDFARKEKNFLQDYVSVCNNHGDYPTLKYHKDKEMVSVIHGAGNSPWCFSLVYKYDLFGKRANNKVIPDQIWSIPREELKKFVAGMWQTDGSIYWKNNVNKGLYVAEWCSISYDMAHQFQKLLLRLGIAASIRYKVPSYVYKNQKHKGQKAYVLTLSGYDKLLPFIEQIKLWDHKRQLSLDAAGHANRSDKGRQWKRNDGNVYWDKVKKIESIGQGDFWTLTAADTHTYTENGLINYQSGKDFISQLICCYAVYLLLCLKDPAGYYGKPDGDNIDIVNVAQNAKQANNVFFSGLKTRIKRCPWFAGKFTTRTTDIEFLKNIRIHSLNSEGESTEGYNILIAVLDEIDGFDEGKTTDNATKMYKTLSATVSSRFSDVGKVLLLSFPRSPDGFMMRKYNEIVAEKNVIQKSHVFKLNDELPDGIEDNEFVINWQEDHIISYKFSHVWAIRRPTWEVNPTKQIEDFIMDFYRDPDDALGRFAACPSDANDGGWFKDKAKIDATFSNPNGVDDEGNIRVKPEEEKEYFIHVDLALRQDNAAVSLAHVDNFKSIKIGSTVFDPAPHVIVDLVRYWKPSRDRPLDFSDIREFIISLRRVGFNIKLVTFDRWRSDQTIEALNNVGINAEVLSVGRDHYSEFALAMGENRVKGPDSELLKKELKRLIVTDKGKIDHPGKTGNDLSDATCGAIYNALTLTERDSSEVEVVTYADVVKENREEKQQKIKNLIKKDKTEMPDKLKSFIDDIRMF